MTELICTRVEKGSIRFLAVNTKDDHMHPFYILVEMLAVRSRVVEVKPVAGDSTCVVVSPASLFERRSV